MRLRWRCLIEDLALPEQRSSLLVVAALTALLMFSYWPGLLSAKAAWNNPQYSHGWIVPLFSVAILFWWRQPVTPVSASAHLAGLGLLVASLAIRLFVARYRIITIDMYTFVPALAGLGAPHWKPDARGLLCGLSRDSHRGHIARAVLEGIALQNVEILAAMKADAGALTVLKVDGGAAANDLLMQLQADLLDVPCVRPQNVETTALGAAALAGLATGVFASKDAVRRVWREDRTFAPGMDEAARAKKLSTWQRAVARASLA
jgi:hypothetical protein